MGVIWLIEANREEAINATEALMGNYPVRVFASFGSFQKLIKCHCRQNPDLLLIDVQSCDLPIENVADICDYYLPHVEKIYLSNKPSDSKCGIVAKPSEAWMLTCMVANVLAQNSTSATDSTLRFRDIVLDVSRLTWQLLPVGEREPLPPKEARILTLLMQRQGACVSRDEIKREIWPDTSVSARTIDSHVSRLRKRLVDAEAQIESVYGGGYQLK